MLLDAGEGMIFPQQDEGETFVVAQQDVVGRAVALDQLGFQQQGFRLAVGGHDGHGTSLGDHPLEPPGQPIDLRIIDDAILERAGLADIEHIATCIVHPIDAGTGR